MKKTIIILAIALVAISCKQANNTAVAKTNPAADTNSTVEIADNHSEKQSLSVYNLSLYEIDSSKSIAFISLTDSYPFSENPALPDVPDLSNQKNADFRYIPLTSEYRKRFLANAKVAETDSVFIYDYSADIPVSLCVKNLSVVACLNIYTETDECPCPSYEYMIGFEIDKNLVGGFSEFFEHSLACIGKENPFVHGQMKPIIWKKTDPKNFPSIKPDSDAENVLRRYAAGDVYMYETADFQYFIRNFFDKSPENADLDPMYTTAKYLVIVDLKTKKTALERAYYSTEGSTPAPLNGVEAEIYNQWMGNLFKNKPPVVFGFEYLSFGCPSIMFLNRSEPDIYISCDNRH